MSADGQPEPIARDQVALGAPAVPPPGSRRLRHQLDDAKVHHFVVEAARQLNDLHCENILIYDVRGLSDVTDYIILGSGTSKRQIKSLGGEIADLASGYGLARFGEDSDDAKTWVVIDFVDVVIHLFDPETRAHYDLEMMWEDAPKVEWAR